MDPPVGGEGCRNSKTTRDPDPAAGMGVEILNPPVGGYGVA